MRPRLIFVGNLDSLLFRERMEVIHRLLERPEHVVFDTKRHGSLSLVHYLLMAVSLIAKVILCRDPVRLVLHGAYTPVLWPLLFLRRVHTVSILQGSELNVDFSGFRAHIIKIILNRSELVVCGHETQVEQAIRLTDISPDRCLIVNWGLKQQLFDIPKRNSFICPVLISPRATQDEYNIPIIFNVIKRLKDEGYQLRFVYVRFNPKFELSDISVADKILDCPSQYELWREIAAADLCVSVPDYDGLSNTVMEALALGSLPVITNLKTYDFLKIDSRLGIIVEFGANYSRNAEELYLLIKKALDNLKAIRDGIEFRRSFAFNHLKEGSGVDSLIQVLRD